MSLRSTVNSPKTVSKTSKCTSKRWWRHQNFKGKSKYSIEISSLLNAFQPFFIIFNPFQPKMTLFDLFDLRRPQITVFPYTNRFLSVFPFPPISESENIVSEWVFIGSRKKLLPKPSGFHGKKPTSGFAVPTGSGKVPHVIARVKLYIFPKFHPNLSIRLGGDNIFNVAFLISCVISWSWGSVKIFVPSY